ncbi:MAG: RnfABCDGE type electron transport complex subunit D [Oscillospiraceae bacterium]|jgi:Na+-translocating ferredoxin:NAD+ oxidoreductase RnfD subunit|nr:RnfABCDGE type electron transport complex subunit D [Oscillospiraceae bacterium]
MPQLIERLSSSEEARRWNVTSLLLTLPLLVMGWYYYGGAALRLAVIGVLTAALCEIIFGRLILRTHTLLDLNAIVVGLWVALMLPADLSPWFAVLGTAFAILVVKIPFGGTLHSPFVPAAAGFAFLTVCFPEPVFTYAPPTAWVPVHSSALTALLQTGQSIFRPTVISSILLGETVGPLGTGCILAIAAAAAAMVILKPRRAGMLSTLGFVLAVAGISLLFPRVPGNRLGAMGMELCAGSLLFAAVYLLPDPATLPRGLLAKFLYGLMAGGLCMLLRRLGSYQDNTCFAILLANGALPLLRRGWNEKENWMNPIKTKMKTKSKKSN